MMLMNKEEAKEFILKNKGLMGYRKISEYTGYPTSKIRKILSGADIETLTLDNRRKLSAESRKEIIQLREAGKPFSEINSILKEKYDINVKVDAVRSTYEKYKKGRITKDGDTIAKSRYIDETDIADLIAYNRKLNYFRKNLRINDRILYDKNKTWWKVVSISANFFRAERHGRIETFLFQDILRVVRKKNNLKTVKN